MDIKQQIRSSGFTQISVADQIEMDATLFNLILHGKRPSPEGFENKVVLALLILDRADKAAEKARLGVLQG